MIVVDPASKTAGKIGHRGGKDGNGTKMMMLRSRRCRRSEACASSAGRRAQIVVVRMMPPHGRWAMDYVTDDAKTYGHRGGEDGDGTKTMMLRKMSLLMLGGVCKQRGEEGADRCHQDDAPPRKMGHG